MTVCRFLTTIELGDLVETWIRTIGLASPSIQSHLASYGDKIAVEDAPAAASHRCSPNEN